MYAKSLHFYLIGKKNCRSLVPAGINNGFVFLVWDERPLLFGGFFICKIHFENRNTIIITRVGGEEYHKR